MNKVVYGPKVREIILKGATELYNAVKTTFGPTSGNVGIARQYGPTTVTHDGVTVAKGIELEGDYRVGAELIKQTATKMDDNLGDGTTTVTILAYHILDGANNLATIGANPMNLRKQLEADSKIALSKLADYSEPAKTKERIAEIATISSGDKEIGSLIADVMNKIGSDGVVTVEEGNGLSLESEITEGFSFERGFASPYMVTDSARMETVLIDPLVALCAKPIASVEQDLLPILEKLQGRKNLLIVCNEIGEEALSVLVLNKLKGVLNVVVVKSPGFGDNRNDILEDIAILTAGTVLSDETPLEFGKARKVIVGKDETTIIGGQGDTKKRLADLLAQAQKADGDFEKRQLKARRAALAGKVAIIRVGGLSETEIEEKKFRVDDAVFAAKAALEEGTVPGGATTLLNLSKELPEDSLLKEALGKPFEVLLDNVGEDVQKWLPKIKPGYGVDVTNPTGVVDLRKSGIIDPTKTVRQAIENAVSIAGTAITMKALVIDVPKKDKKDE